jgi:hypothetical protein
MTPRLDFRYPKERVLLDSATMRLRRLLRDDPDLRPLTTHEGIIARIRLGCAQLPHILEGRFKKASS